MQVSECSVLHIIMFHTPNITPIEIELNNFVYSFVQIERPKRSMLAGHHSDSINICRLLTNTKTEFHIGMTIHVFIGNDNEFYRLSPTRNLQTKRKLQEPDVKFYA